MKYLAYGDICVFSERVKSLRPSCESSTLNKFSHEIEKEKKYHSLCSSMKYYSGVDEKCLPQPSSVIYFTHPGKNLSHKFHLDEIIFNIKFLMFIFFVTKGFWLRNDNSYHWLLNLALTNSSLLTKWSFLFRNTYIIYPDI